MLVAQFAHAYPGHVFQSAPPVVAPVQTTGSAPQSSTPYSVSETGAAQYVVPIEVPQGRGGMAPSLSLSYSSRNPLRGGVANGWVLSLPRSETTPPGRDSGWDANLKLWAAVALLIQIAIYSFV